MGGGVQAAQSGRLWPLGIGLERMGKRLEREEKKVGHWHVRLVVGPMLTQHS